jgi:4-hydroxythreonine-4-phosphate dehydrogenase
MLEVEGLRVALGTVHVSLREALGKLSSSMLVHKAITVEKALRTQFGIQKPRIAMAALNPHAGENGALGLEEIEILQPALNQLAERGILVSGPHPADTLFHATMRKTYDCALCLYHDQGLIPIKTLDFYGGVNITLGLPIVRTSPDHGTAFNIAGRGLANPASLIMALQRAAMLSHNAARHG